MTKPRRCSKRWLDDDCPQEILAIIKHPHTDSYGGGYDIVYSDVQTFQYARIEQWLNGFSVRVSGISIEHFELRAHEVAAYRYRQKHRYTTWSSLPDAVKKAVRDDIAAAKEYEEASK